MLHRPSFTVYTGPMFSSKTSRMLLDLERFRYRGLRVVACKPVIDERYSRDSVVTHGGWTTPATPVATGGEITRLLGLDGRAPAATSSPQVVALDEAFMVPGAADALVHAFTCGLHVVVSTLDLSAAARPFDEVVRILPWATSIVKCTAVCTVCGHDAPYTHKKVGNEAEIQVGGAELYAPRCAVHYPPLFGMLTEF